jgi:hypothetical protein
MTSRSSTPPRRRARPRVEDLEPRLVLSGLQPTGLAQAILERINDVRANPAVVGREYGLNLAGIPASQPLAFDPRLVRIVEPVSGNFARAFNVAGIKQRIRNSGLRFVENDSIVLEGSGPFDIPGLSTEELVSLYVTNFIEPDANHENAFLGTPVPAENAREGSHAEPQFYREVGIAISRLAAGLLLAPADPRPLVTGAVFQDLNGNGRYDVGEGLAGVTIQVAGARPVQTFASGGYTLAVPHAGTYQVTASGGALAAPLTETVTVGRARNARLEFIVP